MNTAAMPARVAIIGAGHAGGRVAQHLRALGHTGSIALIGDEVHLPYERPALSKELLLGVKDAHELSLLPASFWTNADEGVRVERYHARASTVMSEQRLVVLDDADGTQVPFDALVVATGGRARVPQIEGVDLPGVFSLRTIDDSLALREKLATARSIVIVGAGVIGMEVAAAAAKLGLRVTVLEGAPRIMGRVLPPIVSDWLARVHAGEGVRIETGVSVSRIARGVHADLEVHAAASDEVHACDLVLVATGIDCSTPFLDGTPIGGRDGVPVDRCCRSPSVPWCYAAGDVALAFSPRFGRLLRQETWRNAENQSRAVAEFICGRTEPFSEMPWMWTDQFGHNIQVVGRPEQHHSVVVRGVLGEGPATIVSLDGESLAGAVMIDRGRDRRALEALIESRVPVSAERLADPQIPLKQVA